MSSCWYCDRTWTAKGHAHCRAVLDNGTHCCEHFVTNGVANRHWGTGKNDGAPSYNAKHLDPHNVPSLEQDEKGVWHIAGNRPARYDESS